MIELYGDCLKHFSGPDAFERILALQGQVFREMDGRRTLRFIINGRGYFAKLHFGVGWKEIFKNLFQGKLPVLGAENEREAIRRLEELGVATMKVAGFGRRGWNPARRKSFLITEELQNTISLEDFCRDWKDAPPAVSLKRDLLNKVAHIAHQLHSNGINHRDFYICHFLLDKASVPEDSDWPKLHVIDLHRVQMRKEIPKRWAIKDVSGLYFSSMNLGLTQRDLFRFMKIYRGWPLREILQTEKTFWRQVAQSAINLYYKTFHRLPQLPG